MATASTLRKLLDRAQWEMCNPLPFTAAPGTFVVSSLHADQLQLVITGATAQWLYDPGTDAWVQLPSAALAGTFGAGTCGAYHPNGPTGTASAGTATTITTTITAARSLAGYQVRITAGTGAGQERTIASNTLGSNSVLTVSAAWTVTPDATSQFLVQSGRFYVLNGGTLAAGSWRYYDLATNTWASLAITNAPATLGTDARIRATPGAYGSLASGTATAGAATTLTNTGKAWTVNQWTNAQLRIVAGTGAGQIRIIASNTATVLTVTAAWTVTPDATSQYVVEGCDDYIYLAGNNAVTLYRYSISGNTWSTLTPGAARAAAPGAGMSLSWVRTCPDPAWTNEAAIINGRRLYSWRAGGGGALDYYDIAANTWVSSVPYWPFGSEAFSTGSCHDNADRGVLISQKDIAGRFFAYNVATQQLNPLATLMYPQGPAAIGDRLFCCDYTDGATRLQWVYFIASNTAVMFRALLI